MRELEAMDMERLKARITDEMSALRNAPAVPVQTLLPRDRVELVDRLGFVRGTPIPYRGGSQTAEELAKRGTVLADHALSYLNGLKDPKGADLNNRGCVRLLTSTPDLRAARLDLEAAKAESDKAAARAATRNLRLVTSLARRWPGMNP